MDLTTSLTVVLGLSVFFAVVYRLGLNERVKTKLTCPATGTAADVDVLQRYDSPKKPIRVKACSLLPRPNRVDCGQECLKRD